MDIYNDRIKPLFEASGQTDKDLEIALGLSKGTIHKWNHLGYKSYTSHVKEIAQYFHVSADYLLGLTDDKTPAAPAEERLSEKDVNLLAWFRSLPPEKQKEVLYDAGAPSGLV